MHGSGWRPSIQCLMSGPRQMNLSRGVWGYGIAVEIEFLFHAGEPGEAAWWCWFSAGCITFRSMLRHGMGRSAPPTAGGVILHLYVTRELSPLTQVHGEILLENPVSVPCTSPLRGNRHALPPSLTGSGRRKAFNASGSMYG